MDIPNDIYSILGTSHVALGDKVMERLIDIGEWEVYNNGLDVSVTSSDSTHGVWLVVTGDFSDNKQCVAYAEQIAERLNETNTKEIE